VRDEKNTVFRTFSHWFGWYFSRPTEKATHQKRSWVKPEEVRQLLLSGFEQDPKFLWKLEQDESQRICSQYPSREAMPAQAVQKVIELENKNIVYPQWGIYLGRLEGG
jgi:hypothetical protein